ncbi:MAG: NAD(P)/FAD-dependent oxidoreductase [Anaerolineae bacterium]
MTQRVVVIGAGFGGLAVVSQLAKYPVDVLLIDRHNYHTFTPLLYQVATCGLDPSEIAYPVRSIFRKKKNVQFLLGEVTGIDHEQKSIQVRAQDSEHVEHYDYLVVATGTVTNYFNNPSIEHFGFGLKSLDDSIELRNHILRLFERAAWTDDEAERKALMTLVVVGGGPTGLETAGALYELYNHVLTSEYSKPELLHARVVLVEAIDRLLAVYPERLQKSAYKQLTSLGVEVILNQAVQTVAQNHIVLNNGDVIPTYTLVWAAGVKASPFVTLLDVELQRGGRVPVKPTMEVIGRDYIYAVGDIAHLTDSKGVPYPQVIPVAQQQGKLVAENIAHRIANEAESHFVYHDRGIMATIGRRRAVAWPFYRIQLTGFLAWVTWLGLHLVWLLGFRNRLNVFINWVWNYLTYDRSVRIILDAPRELQTEQKPDVSDVRS